RDAPELPLQDAQAALRLVGDRNHPLLDAHPAAAAAPDRADDDRAAAVHVAVEQAVEGDDGLGVSGGRVDEVDHQARLLAWVTSGDSPDALLIHAARGGWREMHADGRA